MCRAQVSGRICLGVNDAQTAEMVLSGLPPDVQKRALTLARPGLAIVQHGLDWHYARSTYLSTTEIRALATTHAERRVDWADLMLTDRVTFNHHQQTAARP